MASKSIVASSKRHLSKMLLVILILSTTSCILAVSEQSEISPPQPVIHEQTFEGDYLDSVSFQTRIDITNWAFWGTLISFYAAAMIGVIVIRRKSSKKWHRFILSLLIILIFCEGLNFHRASSFFMASLNGSNQPATVVVKRHTFSDLIVIPIWYQISNDSMAIWTPLANIMINQLIKQSESQ